MNRKLVVALAALAAAACAESTPLGPGGGVPTLAFAPPSANGDVIVSNSNDAGPGSFRDAIAQANANASIQTIAFLPQVNTIHLQSGIEFSGIQGLTIAGNNATLDAAAAGGTAFLASGGGNLTLTELTVRDAAGEGVRVEVPPLATGTIRVALANMVISGNTGHGVLVNDQEDSSSPVDADGEPLQPPANGSAASLEVIVTDSRIIGNGYSVSDRDGLRVNEGGTGSLTFTLVNSRAEDNAADGIELDERGPGDVRIDVLGARVVRNGRFDPADLDDGFDIDECDDGGIFGIVAHSVASHNYEEGLDFNENNAGDLRVDMTDVDASWNGEEGIDLEEDDDFGGGGDLVTTMTGIKVTGNGDGADGALKIREKEAGNLSATLTDIIATNNTGSGIFVRESQAGNSTVSITKAVSNGNRAGALDPFSLGHGIELLESGGGDLTATVSNSTVSANAGAGVFGDETGAGAGAVSLSGVKGNGNALGATGGTAIVP